MIKEFIITNETTYESVSFGQTTDFDYIFKDNGLDWGYAAGEHSTYSYPGQVGLDISMTHVMDREIAFTGWVYYVPKYKETIGKTPEQIRELCYAKIKEKKKKLNALINPNDYLKVTIGDYYISGKPSKTISYGSTRETNNEYFCNFYITIYCSNPMFKKTEITKTGVFTEKPVFKFPFFTIPGIGVIMSIRENYLLLVVNNEGDTKVGARIILEAMGDGIENPTIENLITGEKIVINKTMKHGERIYINTRDGGEKGIIGLYKYTEYNYFKYWDFENDWMKFPKGTSLIGYTTSNEMESLLNVTIELNPEKLGLEDM